METLSNERIKNLLFKTKWDIRVVKSGHLKDYVDIDYKEIREALKRHEEEDQDCGELDDIIGLFLLNDSDLVWVAFCDVQYDYEGSVILYKYWDIILDGLIKKIKNK